MLLLHNPKAKFDYEIKETLMAGIVLEGREVKSLRGKSGSLKEAYVKIIGGEAFLINAQISPYKYADNSNYDPKRTRKILLKKREITKLAEATDNKKMTLVPLTLELTGKHIKLQIGVGRGKKQYEKKAIIKRRDQERDLAREMKDHS